MPFDKQSISHVTFPAFQTHERCGMQRTYLKSSGGAVGKPGAGSTAHQAAEDNVRLRWREESAAQLSDEETNIRDPFFSYSHDM